MKQTYWTWDGGLQEERYEENGKKLLENGGSKKILLPLSPQEENLLLKERHLGREKDLPMASRRDLPTA